MMQPLCALYENVQGACKSCKGTDGKVHDPAVTVTKFAFIKVMHVYLDIAFVPCRT